MPRVLFFGRLRDMAGCSEREIACENDLDLPTFRRLASLGDHDLEEALAARSVRVALNAVLVPVAATCSVSPGDEVAFMPPFSGG